MKKFRVFRGAVSDINGKMMGCGLIYNAETAKDAVRQDEEHIRAIFGQTGPLNVWVGTKPHPIVSVSELVLVAESDWR